MKISEITFEQICEILKVAQFNMHTNDQDYLRTVSSPMSFENARKELMSNFGDVEISLHPDAYWFDQVKIEDENWKSKYNDYCNRKQTWCDKYGCD